MQKTMYMGTHGGMMIEFDYKEYVIVQNFFGNGEYAVQYCGDNIVFKTEDEAMKFIDSVSEEKE